MDPPKKILFLCFLFSLSFPLQSHARESKFFSKSIPENKIEDNASKETIGSSEQELPSPSPDKQDEPTLPHESASDDNGSAHIPLNTNTTTTNTTITNSASDLTPENTSSSGQFSPTGGKFESKYHNSHVWHKHGSGTGRVPPTTTTTTSTTTTTAKNEDDNDDGDDTSNYMWKSLKSNSPVLFVFLFLCVGYPVYNKNSNNNNNSNNVNSNNRNSNNNWDRQRLEELELTGPRFSSENNSLVRDQSEYGRYDSGSSTRATPNGFYNNNGLLSGSSNYYLV